MESIKELKEEIRKLNIEKSLLEEQVKNLSNTSEVNDYLVEEAKTLLDSVPTDFVTKSAAKLFLVTEKELNILNLLHEKAILKFIENSNNLVIDQNNIILNGKIIGTVADDRFKVVLEKVVPVMPYLFNIYARYYHFYTLCTEIDRYEYLGKLKI